MARFALKQWFQVFLKTLVAGVLIVFPVYLAVLMVLKAMKSLEKVVRPLVSLVPGWFPGEAIVSLLIITLLCILVGVVARTALGARIENSVLVKIPLYAVFRGMAQQLAGDRRDSTWQPALAEIEEALVPAFIVEELDDGRFTVFVPSVPTPLAGTVYILTADRVHQLNVPFTQAIRAVTRWGVGSKELVAAMRETSSVH